MNNFNKGLFFILIFSSSGFDPVIPAPIQFGPSVKPPLNKDINSNHNDRGSHEEKENSTKGVSGMYKPIK